MLYLTTSEYNKKSWSIIWQYICKTCRMCITLCVVISWLWQFLCFYNTAASWLQFWADRGTDWRKGSAESFPGMLTREKTHSSQTHVQANREKKLMENVWNKCVHLQKMHILWGRGRDKAKSDLITSCDSAAHWVIINVRSTQFNFKEKLCNLFMFNHRKVPELFWLLVCR